MKINYCDCCGQPLKPSQVWLLSVLKESTPDTPGYPYKDEEEYKERLCEVEKSIREICPTCKIVIEKIFELRLQNLSKLSDELLGIYNLKTPSQAITEKKKKGKK